MEFADGEDLSAVLARGAVPLGDALRIARQIADALEATGRRICPRTTDTCPASLARADPGTPVPIVVPHLTRHAALC
jgi:hypothetical protein